MRTCYCRKCGSANEIEEDTVSFFCVNCGVESNVPKKRTEDVRIPEDNTQNTEETATTTEQPVYTYTQPVEQPAFTQPTEQPAFTQPTEQPAFTQPVYSYQNMDTVQDKPAKKKGRAGLIIGIVFGLLVIAAGVLMLTPVKSPLPVKFRCDSCKKIKFSQKYKVEYTDTNEIKTEFICDDCFDEKGYEEE